MPDPIYRHVVPNAPQKSLNGYPCYRDGAPSYKRLMQFGVSWSGTVHNAGPSNISRSSDAMNHLLVNPDYSSVQATRYYSATPDFTPNVPPVFCQTEGMPELEWYLKGHYELRYLDPSDGLYHNTDLVDIVVGLEWRSSLSYWRWWAFLCNYWAWDNLQTAMWLNIYNSSVTPAAGSGWAVFKGPATTDKLRVGNGTALSFDRLRTVGTINANHPNFNGCSIIVSAQYAQ